MVLLRAQVHRCRAIVVSLVQRHAALQQAVLELAHVPSLCSILERVAETAGPGCLAPQLIRVRPCGGLFCDICIEEDITCHRCLYTHRRSTAANPRWRRKGVERLVKVLLAQVLVHELWTPEQLAADRAPELGVADGLRAGLAELQEPPLVLRLSGRRATSPRSLPSRLAQPPQPGLLLAELALEPRDLHLGAPPLHLGAPHLLRARTAAGRTAARVQAAPLHLGLLAVEVQAAGARELLHTRQGLVHGRPGTGPVRQAQPGKLHEVAVQAAGEAWQLPANFCMRQLHLAEVGEGELPRGELEEDDAEGVDVRLLGHPAGLLVEHLGRGPDGRDAAKGGVERRLLAQLCQAEIAKLGLPRAIEQHIGRLQVQMQNFDVVEVCHAPPYSNSKHLHLSHRQARFRVLVQEGGEDAAVHPLRDQQEGTVRATQVNTAAPEADDVGVREPGKHRDLQDEVADVPVRGIAVADLLDSDGLARPRALEDLPEAAPTRTVAPVELDLPRLHVPGGPKHAATEVLLHRRRRCAVTLPPGRGRERGLLALLPQAL
mmetsp:Transcript_98715/g.274683  ORF Transcript_98715/g.274683 Transcript_98715/m.274683 type:complete len:546 (+) Transcript_98715:575-2212(+)